MESSPAAEIWKRTHAKHNLVYGIYIGDGESSSDKNLLKSDPYNGVAYVRKEECLGHVQKLMKKRLRTKTKFFRGLPVAKAAGIADLYALLIVQHKGEGFSYILAHTEKNTTLPRRIIVLVIFAQLGAITSQR